MNTTNEIVIPELESQPINLAGGVENNGDGALFFRNV